MALAHVLVLDHLSGTNGGAVAREDFCLQVLLATRVMSERSCDHDASRMQADVDVHVRAAVLSVHSTVHVARLCDLQRATK